MASHTVRIDLSHARHAPLTAAEESAVVAIIRAGGAAAIGAQNKLVNANLKFVVTMARRYRGLGMPVEDMISEGSVGLVRAAASFDPVVGVRFLSYAVWWIRQAILKAIMDQASTIRTPAPSVMQLYHDKATASGNKGRASSTKLRMESMQTLRRLERLDQLLEQGREPVDECAAADARVSDWDRVREIEARLATLDPGDREIMSRYFGLGTGECETLAEVGERLGLTRERVRQRKVKAMIRMRKAVW